jgi:hypothetical protein
MAFHHGICSWFNCVRSHWCEVESFVCSTTCDMMGECVRTVHDTTTKRHKIICHQAWHRSGVYKRIIHEPHRIASTACKNRYCPATHLVNVCERSYHNSHLEETSVQVLFIQKRPSLNTSHQISIIGVVIHDLRPVNPAGVGSKRIKTP